jgi:hypothetical protein
MQVEEIGDMESDKSKLFKEALANEKNSGLEGKQKIVLKKVDPHSLYCPKCGRTFIVPFREKHTKYQTVAH